MSWARVSVLDVGPTLPATQTLRGASSAALRARRAAWRAISYALSEQPYSFWEILLAEKELVSMMSAPASMYALCMELMTSGRVKLKLSLLPLSPLRWSIVPIAPSSMSILL